MDSLYGQILILVSFTSWLLFGCGDSKNTTKTMPKIEKNTDLLSDQKKKSDDGKKKKWNLLKKDNTMTSSMKVSESEMESKSTHISASDGIKKKDNGKKDDEAQTLMYGCNEDLKPFGGNTKQKGNENKDKVHEFKQEVNNAYKLLGLENLQDKTAIEASKRKAAAKAMKNKSHSNNMIDNKQRFERTKKAVYNKPYPLVINNTQSIDQTIDEQKATDQKCKEEFGRDAVHFKREKKEKKVNYPSPVTVSEDHKISSTSPFKQNTEKGADEEDKKSKQEKTNLDHRIVDNKVVPSPPPMITPLPIIKYEPINMEYRLPSKKSTRVNKNVESVPRSDHDNSATGPLEKSRGGDSKMDNKESSDSDSSQE